MKMHLENGGGNQEGYGTRAIGVPKIVVVIKLAIIGAKEKELITSEIVQ